MEYVILTENMEENEKVIFEAHKPYLIQKGQIDNENGITMFCNEIYVHFQIVLEKNLKLFETQRQLREQINYDEPDRTNKLCLWLISKIGGLADEFQELRQGNQLLETYARCRPYIIEIGLEFNLLPGAKLLKDEETIEEVLLDIVDYTILIVRFSKIYKESELLNIYTNLWIRFEELGRRLGFTQDEIEQVYSERGE